MSETSQNIQDTESDGKKTPEVLAYRVGQLEIRQEAGFKQLADQNVTLLKKIDSLAQNFATINDLNTLSKEEQTAHINLVDKIDTGDKALSDRLAKVENWLTWAGRIVVGAVLLAVIGVVIANR